MIPIAYASLSAGALQKFIDTLPPDAERNIERREGEVDEEAVPSGLSEWTLAWRAASICVGGSNFLCTDSLQARTLEVIPTRPDHSIYQPRSRELRVGIQPAQRPLSNTTLVLGAVTGWVDGVGHIFADHCDAGNHSDSFVVGDAGGGVQWSG